MKAPIFYALIDLRGIVVIHPHSNPYKNPAKEPYSNKACSLLVGGLFHVMFTPPTTVPRFPSLLSFLFFKHAHHDPGFRLSCACHKPCSAIARTKLLLDHNALTGITFCSRGSYRRVML